MQAMKVRKTPLYLTLVGLIASIVVAYFVATNRISAFDEAIIHFVQGKESPFWTGFAKFCAFIGSTVPVIVIALITMLFLFFVLKHREELILFVIVVGGSALLNVVLKRLFTRERPTIHRILEETGYSFPSGHAMAAFSLYGVIVFLLWKHIRPRWGRVLLLILGSLIIAMIGISRVYAGVHYPSDVLAGYLVAGSWLAFCIYWYQWYRERKSPGK
ncbi:phosphatase PAP2 family protein [Paenibacillus terrigena]|uniref:phosphatase PAP2 family protein n=1 Tax=Paenibacillus terrigena TaxID=369333 RepID=UPI0028D7182F|nr:phosphatase PAP2 family protein [Paenibacillus terrigena]